jgi:proteic killer suppression protein
MPIHLWGELALVLERPELRYIFKKKKIADLYEHEKDAHKHPAEVVDAFFSVMSIIKAAKDMRDLYSLASLHFEKLKGDRSDDRSIKLNDQWRLTLRSEADEQGNFLLIIDIEDYHKKKHIK